MATTPKRATILKTPVTDKYEIGAVLGSGNYSVVKMATEKDTRKEWAAKIITKKDAGPKGLQVLQSEVDILSSCEHPNVVRLNEVYETDEHYYIIMELIKGGELFDKIVELQSYSERDASRLIHQIISAVAHLHELGIVHRDLKPENLLLANESIESPVLLADFGLAKVVDPANPLNVPVGTPGYVAPEVVMCLDDPKCTYGLEVDMWAVGVVLYILYILQPWSVPQHSSLVLTVYHSVHQTDCAAIHLFMLKATTMCSIRSWTAIMNTHHHTGTRSRLRPKISSHNVL
jgi:calcium/calmodulin-dependent protein kinase I